MNITTISTAITLKVEINMTTEEKIIKEMKPHFPNLSFDEGRPARELIKAIAKELDKQYALLRMAIQEGRSIATLGDIDWLER
jgi:hypothetical protein